MSEIKVYVDATPNLPKNDQTTADVANMLRQTFEQGLPEAVERKWQLPFLLLQRPDDNYLALLIESRELFVAGYFYSCVALCGIVGERLTKDLLRASVHVQGADGKVLRPASEAFDQLERVDASALVRFLKAAGLIDDACKKAALDLGELRNKYAHARVKGQPQDAAAAIGLLQTLVEATVSVFRDFELKPGKEKRVLLKIP